MPETKIIFLRVGIDRGCGGRLSPVEADGKFEYVPIPEGAPVHNALRYADIPSRQGGTLAQVIGMDAPAHYDPEFITYSYGERGVQLRYGRKPVIESIVIPNMPI